MLASILNQFEAQIGSQTYTTWFSSIDIVDQLPQSLTLIVPNEFYKHKLDQLFIPTLKQLLKQHELSKTPIHIQIIPPAPLPVEPPRHSDTRTEEGNSLDSASFSLSSTDLLLSSVQSKYTFDQFIMCPQNSFALAVAQAAAESPGETYNPLYIYSLVGLGKTHLLQSIVHALRIEHPILKTLYLSTEQFTNELIIALQSQSIDSFRHKFRSVDVLILDDIHFMSQKERTQEEFFHTFNYLYDQGKQIILSANVLPDKLPGIDDRLVSRFSMGITADIQPPDFETRVAILQQLIRQKGLVIPPEILHFIANHATRNVRELEGAITRAIALQALYQQELSLSLVKESFGDLIPQQDLVSPQNIQKIVCDHFHLSMRELLSPRRHKSLVIPRQIAVFLMRKHTRLSYPEIGQLFGGRDHTTVLHAFQKIELQIQSNHELFNLIQDLEYKIFSS